VREGPGAPPRRGARRSACHAADAARAPQMCALNKGLRAACRCARQVLRMINHDAALGYLEYYGEDALGISIVSPRVRLLGAASYARASHGHSGRRASRPALHGG